MPAASGDAVAKPGCILGILFGAMIGSLCAGFVFVTGLHFTWDLKSSDFLSAVLSALGVMLAAVSVLIAILALALAFGAIIGWQDFKKWTGEAAAQNAAAVAGPKAVEVAVPAAIQQVDRYLDKNLAPEIRQNVIAIVSQVVTPDFLKEVISKSNKLEDIHQITTVPQPDNFSEEAIKEAASEEMRRQEQTMDAFDATVEAEELRGDSGQPQDDE